ncbi:MAG: beta-ketoacyl synthase chain length factor [Bacteroidales bacterium]|nr:beta-ketoacyl synthase chain length factor [Bacteroidales bacterium]
MNPVYISAATSYSDEWDLKTLIPDANMRRRMSRLVKMGVASGLQCLAEAGIGSPDAIITASGYGCLTDSEKFLTTLIANKEQLLNPTPFIQSTFNTIGSQIAILTKCKRYNMTYVDGAESFTSALLDAMLSVGDGAKTVLVGITDELTPTLTDILKRMRISVATTDGAYFFALTSEKTDSAKAVISNVELIGRQCAKNSYTFPTAEAQQLFQLIENKTNSTCKFDKLKFDLQCL